MYVCDPLYSYYVSSFSLCLQVERGLIMVRYLGLLNCMYVYIECVCFFVCFLDALAHNFKQTSSSRFSMYQCEVCHKGFTGFMKQALRCVGKWGK